MRRIRRHRKVIAVAAGTVAVAAAAVVGIANVTSTNGVIHTDKGWDASGLHGTAPTHCTIRKAANGEPLPDPACTPGAVDDAVKQSTLSTTICRPGGYTSSVRAPVGLTDAFKQKVMVAYGLNPVDASAYELDHLVPLEDGGSNDVRNLWPEPNSDLNIYTHSGFVHNDKDKIETLTHDQICAGTVPLGQTQDRIAADWSKFIQTS